MSSDQQQQKQVQLSEVNIDNENTALNVMVAMLNMAQRRGAFSMEESSKCWECVRMIMKQNAEGESASPVQESPDGSNENVVM